MEEILVHLFQTWQVYHITVMKLITIYHNTFLTLLNDFKMILKFQKVLRIQVIWLGKIAILILRKFTCFKYGEINEMKLMTCIRVVLRIWMTFTSLWHFFVMRHFLKINLTLHITVICQPGNIRYKSLETGLTVMINGREQITSSIKAGFVISSTLPSWKIASMIITQNLITL